MDKITAILLKVSNALGDQKNLFTFAAYLKGVLYLDHFLNTAEIIPNEPGQVMLPRDKDARKSKFAA